MVGARILNLLYESEKLTGNNFSRVIIATVLVLSVLTAYGRMCWN